MTSYPRISVPAPSYSGTQVRLLHHSCFDIRDLIRKILVGIPVLADTLAGIPVGILVVLQPALLWRVRGMRV